MIRIPLAAMLNPDLRNYSKPSEVPFHIRTIKYLDYFLASKCMSHQIVKQSKEECEYLIELAKPHMVKSTVVDSTTGESKDSRYAHMQILNLLRDQDTPEVTTSFR
jgi:hypothetical protein